MTQTAEKPETEKKVLVLCDGIADRTGFSMSPDGMSPDYVEFAPGVATPMKKEYAEYLVAMDKDKFSIVKDEAKPETDKESPAAKKAAKKAEKKAAQEAASAATK